MSELNNNNNINNTENKTKPVVLSWLDLPLEVKPYTSRDFAQELADVITGKNIVAKDYSVFSSFITKSPCKTKPMDVTVIDATNKIIRNYSAPAGFQMDRYCSSLPNVKIITGSWESDDYVIKCFDTNNKFIESHTGKYIK